MKLKIAALLTALFVAFPLSLINIGAAGALIEEGFEVPASGWAGGVISPAAAYRGKAGCSVNNPGIILDEFSAHFLDYKKGIWLAAGEVYRASLWVKAASGAEEGPFSASALAHGASKTVNFAIRGASLGGWQRAEALFTVQEAGDYVFRASLYGADEAAVFYVDDIKLESTGMRVLKSRIDGRQNVLIPELGAAVYEYELIALDGAGNRIENVSGELYAVGDLPGGVSFEAGRLRVSNEVVPGAMLRLRGGAIGAAPAAEITVYFDKNHIVNGGFEDMPLYRGWERGGFDIEGEAGKRVALLKSANEGGAWVSNIKADGAITLFAGKMYVLRARVRSLEEYPTRDISVVSEINEAESLLNFSVSNIGGEEWTQIVAAVRVSFDGNYQLRIEVASPDKRPIYIDNLSLTQEELRPALISVRAPGQIAVPKAEMTLPASYVVRNQEGGQVLGESVSAEILPSGRGIRFDGETGRILVSPSVVTGMYRLVVTSETEPDVSGAQTIIVAEEAVGDGGFETKAPGYMWATGSPSVFGIVGGIGSVTPPEGAKMGRLDLNGSVSVLLNDSYMRYDEDGFYIFEAKFYKARPDVDTTITVILQNTDGAVFEDNVIISQFELGGGWHSVRQAFFVPNPLTGRLMVAFNTPEEHSEQIIYLDDIEISAAGVFVKDVSIFGTPYVDRTLTGRYTFESNFGGVDASKIVWLISPHENGAYLPIVGQNARMLELTADMLGKYIKFGVTPASFAEGITGERVLSAPVKVVAAPQEGSWPKEPDIKPSEPPVIIIPAPGGDVSPVKLAGAVPWYGFVDMAGHWAGDDVSLMAGAGIVEGRGAGLFSPQDEVTRAEFSAFIVRGLGLAPSAYRGIFSDVFPGEWFAGVVQTVVDFEIAAGMGEGVFSPNTPITREQIALMCARAAKRAGREFAAGKAASFADSDKISPWAADAISRAAGAGIILGDEKGFFEPGRNATRAEAAAIIKRMLMSFEAI